ncbi:hypothetical protein Psta_2889 [Pirellula staleyi DSM 6068]|uniref:Uncharacterized protein n=1 Tax=Pirellula staleyi (strain ATCC 27377 / DSM 6068 / ICPB 4128) TaxID=530564 RepID=D2R8L3_PIRSD|nr:hypothetical protein [Pirellula staleyi]ADB17554.1 hypothetical protein Psta_2889 [Pirellula staleyi DSM 6068]
MQPQALPSLADLSYQLANQNARVVSLLDSLPGMVDQLLFAAKSKDWPEVSRLSQVLAHNSQTGHQPHLAESAARLAAAAQTRDNELEIQKQLVRLVGLCGRVQNPPASA